MTTTTYVGAYLPVVTGDSGVWGGYLNTRTFVSFDLAIGGIASQTLTNANVTLSAAQSNAMILALNGTLAANVQVTTLKQGVTLVENYTTGAHTVTFTNGVGATVVVPQNTTSAVASDATGGCFLAAPIQATTLGQVAMFVGSTVPTGWIKANGALVSRTTYANLWAYAQSSGTIVSDATWASSKVYGAFSTGDGATTFRVPDLRGFFPRGWADDNSGSLDYGRANSTFQEQANLSHTHVATVTDPGHHHILPFQNTGPYSGSGNVQYHPEAPAMNSSDAVTGISVSNALSGGAQNIPQNIAMMFCVSYR